MHWKVIALDMEVIFLGPQSVYWRNSIRTCPPAQMSFYYYYDAMVIPDWVRSWELRMPVCSSQTKQSLLISGVDTRNARSAYIVAQNIVAQWHAVSYKLPFTYCSYPRDSAWVPVTIRSPEPWATSGYRCLTHWGRVTHICVGNLTIIGSDNGLSPGRRQAIIRTNIGLLSCGTLGICINESFDAYMTISF